MHRTEEGNLSFDSKQSEMLLLFFLSLFFRYFFPTYENDSLLCSLEDDEADEERVEEEVST